MRPGNPADEPLEELGCGDGPPPASVADILDVGHLAPDLLVELGVHRQLPDRLPDGPRRGGDLVTPGLIVREQAGDVVAEGHHAGPRQGGGVDDPLGGHFPDDIEDIGKHHSPLGIGVVNLDRRAAAGGDHVAELVGRRSGHVFRQSADRDEVYRESQGRDRGGGGEHRRGPGHVALHRQHPVRCFERQAAGIEGHPLADEGDMRGAGRDPGAAVGELHQTRRP